MIESQNKDDNKLNASPHKHVQVIAHNDLSCYHMFMDQLTNLSCTEVENTHGKCNFWSILPTI